MTHNFSVFARTYTLSEKSAILRTSSHFVYDNKVYLSETSVRQVCKMIVINYSLVKSCIITLFLNETSVH